MVYQVKYKNILKQPITEQQMKVLDSYEVISYTGQHVKKTELIRKLKDSTKRVVSYFLEPGEDKNQIIEEYCNLIRNSQCIIYFNKQNSGVFNLWEWENYNSSKDLKFKGQEVFDQKNRTTFYCSFDLNTSQLQSGARKYYYGNQFEGDYEDILLYFVYDVDGELELIYDTNENYGYTKGISLETFLNDTEFSQIKFPWITHPYYHSVYPFLPAGFL